MRKVVLLLLLLLLVAAVWWAVERGPLREPAESLADFYAAEGRFEDQLTDPLVLNARRVAPLVLEAVVEPEMKHRREAIKFLGCQRYEPALPVLRRILADEEESDTLRGDALEGIWLVRPAEGRAVASELLEDQTFVGQVARGISSGAWDPWCRSWWEALRRVHH